MSKQLMIYSSVAPLTRSDHGDLSYRSDGRFDFAREIHVAPLVAAEFALASGEFPIIFADGGEAPMPVVLLGVAEGQNLFVGAEADWKAGYVPAFFRRWPFVFSTSAADDQYTLCIDEAAPGFNREGRGERLFDSEGVPTVFTNRMLDFLREYQAQHALTQAFGARLRDLGLLHSVEAQLSFAGRATRTLTGLQVVNRERLKALASEEVEKLFRQDMLELIHLHLSSLRMLERLRDRAAERATEPQAA